jgi:hypothetical protein
LHRRSTTTRDESCIDRQISIGLKAHFLWVEEFYDLSANLMSENTVQRLLAQIFYVSTNATVPFASLPYNYFAGFFAIEKQSTKFPYNCHLHDTLPPIILRILCKEIRKLLQMG